MRSCHLLLPLLLVLPALRAEHETLIFRPLPKPPKLPPGLEQTLPLNKRHSFFGDTLRPVDCTDDRDVAYGTCGNLLFGGLAMTTSHLSGDITIRFRPPVNQVAHFEVVHGVLRGDDGRLVAPQGYELPVLFNQVSDAPNVLSEGDLDLTTGGVTNIRYRVRLLNSAILALSAVNPKLDEPVIEFPGERGHAWIRFEQRPDGLLDFLFQGNTFLPLGRETKGDPVRWPMPFCGPRLACASILARGTSLRPHLTLSTKAPGGKPCAPSCPDIPFNTVQEFTVASHNSSFGDDFELNIPELGGGGPGRSHLQGRLMVQFGARTPEDTVPFTITSLVPEGLLANPPESPILGRGPSPGLIGQVEWLRFPRATYKLERVVFVDEPYNVNHGVLDLKTGLVLGEFVYPSFFGQSLADALFEQNDGRIEKRPFNLVAKCGEQPGEQFAVFERGANGQTVFRYSGEHVRSFETYRFPSPDLAPSKAYSAGFGARLSIFLRLQAMKINDVPQAVKAGGAANLESSLGDRFSYSYTIPCDGRSVRPAFEYVNFNPGPSGGTFRLTRLASVSCTNSRGSRLPTGDYDTVTFAAFGTWSKDDPADPPRLVTVQISNAPDCPYVGILLYQTPDAQDNVVLSSANTKPRERPLP